MTASVLGNSVAKFDKWRSSAGVAHGTIVNYSRVVYNAGSDSYTVVSTADYLHPIVMTYTPKYADSLLVVNSTHGTRSYGASGGGQGMASRLLRDGASITTAGTNSGNFNYATSFYYKGDTVNHHRTLENRVVVPANSTAATTFRIALSVVWGSHEIAYGWGVHSIQVWEIQQ